MKNSQKTRSTVEYFKLALVLMLVAAIAALHAGWRGFELLQYLESYMGVFFAVFAGFKLYNLKEFAYGFKSYEIMKHKSVAWGYVYPFMQVLFGGLYLLNYGTVVLDSIVLAWSAFGACVVLLTLRRVGDIHCLCLGNMIKLPLSTVSFIEDFGMAVIAAAMIVLRLT